MLKPDATAPAPDVGNGAAGLNPPCWNKPPLPRPEGAAPLKIQSTPKVSESVSFTSAIVTSIITCREATSSFFSACSMIEYSDGVATISTVFWSLSATTWMLRTTPTPSPPTARAPAAAPTAAPAAAAAAGAADAAGVFGVTIGCVWNDGGETIWPAGVPGASVGGPAVV